MANADAYRLRIKTLEKKLKKASKTDRAVMQRKLQALKDVANNEDWLDGKASHPSN